MENEQTDSGTAPVVSGDTSVSKKLFSVVVGQMQHIVSAIESPFGCLVTSMVVNELCSGESSVSQTSAFVPGVRVVTGEDGIHRLSPTPIAGIIKTFQAEVRKHVPEELQEMLMSEAVKEAVKDSLGKLDAMGIVVPGAEAPGEVPKATG